MSQQVTLKTSDDIVRVTLNEAGEPLRVVLRENAVIIQTNGARVGSFNALNFLVKNGLVLSTSADPDGVTVDLTFKLGTNPLVENTTIEGSALYSLTLGHLTTEAKRLSALYGVTKVGGEVYFAVKDDSLGSETSLYLRGSGSSRATLTSQNGMVFLTTAGGIGSTAATTQQLIAGTTMTLQAATSITSTGSKHSFTPAAGYAGINVGSLAGNPSSLANGDMWYNSSSNELNARINGATVALGAGGAGGSWLLASGGTLTGNNVVSGADTYDIKLSDLTYFEAVANSHAITIDSLAIGLQAFNGAEYTQLIVGAAGAGTFVLRDNRATATGIQYFADYSANYTARSLVDKGYVDSVAGGASWLLASGGTATGTNTWTFGTNPWLVSTGVTTGSGATAGMRFLANSLTTGIAQDQSTSSATTGFLSKYTSTSTVINHTLGTHSLVGIDMSGANSTSAKTAVGLMVKVANTGTTSTNVAIYVSASGATTNTAIEAIGAVNVTGNITSTPASGTAYTANPVAGATGLLVANVGGVSGLGIGTSHNLNGSYQAAQFSNASGGASAITYITISNNAGNGTFLGIASSGHAQANLSFLQASVSSQLLVGSTGGVRISSALALPTTSTRLDVVGIGNAAATNKTLRLANTAAQTTEVLDNGNVGLFGSTAYGSGVGVLAMTNAGTNATTALTNGIVIHAKDSSDGSANSTLAIYTEQAPEATATFTQTHRIKVWWNNTEYWMSLDAV